MINLKVNGRELQAKAGTTVLEAAREHGIVIPNLCSSRHLAPYGGCRLCLVEIKGRKGYAPACCTYVEDGLDVRTETPELQALRRLTLELILSEHPHACLICAEKPSCEEFKSTIRKVGEVTGCVLCPENGDCRLQEAVELIRPERVRFPASYREFEVHKEDPFFDRNYNLCILCGRCVRVCGEVRGAAVISFVNRGPRAVIQTAFDRPLLDSGCQLCGACVDACPTGALTERAVKGQGPVEETRPALCALCGVGCSLELGLKRGAIMRSVPREGDCLNDGQACVRGRFVVREAVHSARRVLRPMVRRDGRLVETSWDEALERAASGLKGLAPGEAALVSSAQLPLEDQYLLRKFAGEFWRTVPVGDVPEGSALSGYASALAPAGLEPALNFELASIAGAKVILVVGADLPVSQPILWLEVLRAVRGGAVLFGIDTDQPAISRGAAYVFRPGPERRFGLLASIARLVAERKAGDEETDIRGLAEFLGSLPALDIGRDAAEEPAGAAHVRSAARLLAESRPGVILAGGGLTGQADAGEVFRMLWNLAALTGARVIPLAEEGNERGAFELRRGLSARLASGAAPGNRKKALYLVGDLPPAETKPADFLVFQGSYLTGWAEAADVVLPAAVFAETRGTWVNIEGRIQLSPSALPPAGESRPDWWITAELGRRLGGRAFRYPDPRSIADELAAAVPALAGAAAVQKTGRPAFVAEKPLEVVKLFVPRTEPGRTAGAAAGSRPSGDRYRGLDLAAEVKGLKRLRQRTEKPHA